MSKKNNQMYATEAVYVSKSGKYNQVYLRGYKKADIDGYDLMVREPLEEGNKVIVLDMR